jgi:predicted phosphodiesterase
MSYEHERRFWKVLPKGTKLLLFFMLGVVLLFEVYTFVVVYTEGNAPLPAAFGNFERVRRLLASHEQREEFSFAVVGDRGTGAGTFKRIWEKLRDEPLSFMVHLGDYTRDGTKGYHRFLRREWAQKAPLPFPVFYVVGNHDVDEREFPISQFEKNYGPTLFTFDYQGCLFIVLCVVDKPSTEKSLAFLESSLSARRQDYRKVFVFLHVPPVRPDFAVRSARNTNEFVALFDRYHVDYVFAGHYHAYARVKVRNTVYLVSGGGGASLERGKFGRFHHATVIEVGPDWVSERILHVESERDIGARAEEFVLAELYPRIVNHWPVAILLNVGILGILFWAFRGFLRNGRRHKF